jgi:hypothetical protein
MEAAVSAAVDAGHLLGSLDEQWRLIGKNEGGVLRACSMTLGVLAGPHRNPQDLGATVAELMHEHPNRTIVLRVAGGAAPVEARTSIQCWMPFGRGKQICCEQIEVEAGLGSLAGVPSILFGLAVADLPVVWWCPDLDLALRPELAPVIGLAGKVIVDTSSLASALDSWDAIQSLRGGRYRLADLVWARLTRWRELLFVALSQRGNGRSPERARITWAGTPLPPAALYLAAWLASRFGWWKQAARRIELACEEAAMPEPGTGRLRSLTLEGGGCALRLYRPAGTGMAIEAEGVAAGARFPVFSDSELLRQELGILGRDPQFEEALGMCPEILEAVR